MHLIHENDNLDAWKAVIEKLLKSNVNEFNFLIKIDDPIKIKNSWLSDYNPKNIRLGDNIQDVINTLFPDRVYKSTNNRSEFYSRYLRLHCRRNKLASRKKNMWGTYFQRLCAFENQQVLKKRFKKCHDDGDALKIYNKYLSTKNQLEVIINALSTWKTASSSALYCHLSSFDLDKPRKLGSPCLQYIQFSKNKDNSLDMFVVYRNHDYFNKALGNFIGLGKLLKFICDESGTMPGSLTCHSIHSFFEISKTNMKFFSGL